MKSLDKWIGKYLATFFCVTALLFFGLVLFYGAVQPGT